MKLKRANQPHHGQGEHGRVRTHHGLMGGPSSAHMPQRKNSGFDDRKGYKGSAQAEFGSKHSGRAPLVDREAGHYHPIGHGSSRQFGEDSRETRRMNGEVTDREGSARRDGYHTGKPSRGDTNVRRGEVGNGKGSAAPGLGKGPGVRGSPGSHLGTAGRGGAGRLGMHDGHKGPQPKKLSEDISHESFERLGAD
jgi:hypothetical protein